MQVSGVVALLLVLPHGAVAGGTCSLGYKQAKAKGTCSTSKTDAASCNTDCCTKDDTKCAYHASSVTCAAGKTPAAAGTATASGGANKNTDCCIAKAACSAGTCSTGYKKMATLTNLVCASAATTATSCNTNCCELDPLKCLKYKASISCALGKYWDATASAATATTAGGADKDTACCTAQASCTAGTCSAGYKKRATLTNLYCTSSATTAASCNTNCCELDTLKCLNYKASISCAAGKYWDATSSAATATTAGGADKNTACCTSKASCSAFFGGGGKVPSTSDTSPTAPALSLILLSIAAVLMRDI